MHRIFIGYDERQPVSFNVLQHSIVSQATEPVSITALRLNQLPIKRMGLTPFTFTRFLVPYLCKFEGKALFLDADILLNGDICELFRKNDNTCAVSVSKGDHRFEWASVMLFNCWHKDNLRLMPEYIEKAHDLHRIGWTNDIGDLPREWNHLVGYDEPKDAKLIHYTQGIPAFPETEGCEYSDLWWSLQTDMIKTVPWPVLMGNSVHAVIVNDTPLPRFLFDEEKQCPKPEYKDKVDRLLGL